MEDARVFPLQPGKEAKREVESQLDPSWIFSVGSHSIPLILLRHSQL